MILPKCALPGCDNPARTVRTNSTCCHKHERKLNSIKVGEKQKAKLAMERKSAAPKYCLCGCGTQLLNCDRRKLYVDGSHRSRFKYQIKKALISAELPATENTTEHAEIITSNTVRSPERTKTLQCQMCGAEEIVNVFSNKRYCAVCALTVRKTAMDKLTKQRTIQVGKKTGAIDRLELRMDAIARAAKLPGYNSKFPEVFIEQLK